MGHLINSLSGDNNLVPFCLWSREFMPKSKKVYKYFFQDSVLWKISNSGIFWNWVALNINLKREWEFANTKLSRKCKIKESGPNWKWKFVFSENLKQKVGDQPPKLSKIGFSMECFFAISLPNNIKTWLQGRLLGTRHQSQVFPGFSLNFLIR